MLHLLDRIWLSGLLIMHCVLCVCVSWQCLQEALQERAQRTGWLTRMNSSASRTHSLPAQPLLHRQDSTSSITSNTSNGTGSSSPSHVHPALRGAQTLPMPPQNSLVSSLAARTDSAASFGVWPQLSGSQYTGRSSSAAVLALPGGVAPPLPSIGAVIAAGVSSGSRVSGLGLEGPHAAAATVAEGMSDSAQGFPLQAGAAAGLPAVGPGHSEAEQEGPSSPRPFQEQQLLVLQQQAQAHAQQQRHQHHCHSHTQQQQQQLGPCASLASSVSSRHHWRCPCFGSPEPCAACAGSTSSSDCGSSHAGCSSSGGGSVQRTPSSTSPLNLSPVSGARQLHVLPQIPQDTPVFPLQLPSSSTAAAAAAAGNSCDEAAGCVQPAGVQVSTLQPPLLRPKALVVSPQTPARSAHVGRKPSSQAGSAAAGSHAAAGALFTRGGSVPAEVLASTASGGLAYTSSAPAAATAYPVLMYPLHTANVAATTATAFGSQPADALLHRLDGSSAGSSSGPRLQQQGSAGLPRQPSAGLRKQARTPAGQAGSRGSSDTGVAVAAATAAAASTLAGGLPRHRRRSTGGSSSGSGSVLPRSLASNTSDKATAGGAVGEQAQQQPGAQQPQQQHGSSDHSNSTAWLRRQGREESQQQHGNMGVLRSASSLHPSLHRSASSVPSEAAAAATVAAGELSSSQSSSPSAVTGAGAAAASLYICSSSGVSRLRSASLDFGNASLYTNPLLRLAAATSSEPAWQEPPQLQMQHSAPAAARAGRSLAAAAVERSAQSAAAAAAAWSAQRPARGRLRADGDSSADSGLSSCGTVFMTARSQAVAAGCADSSFAAEGSGDFSLHGSASVTRLARTPSADTAAVMYAGAGAVGGGDQQAIVGGGCSRDDEAGAVAAAAGHGSSVGLAVSRKVSFAEAEPQVLG